MQFLFTKLQIKPKNCFIFITICFCLFVLLCSALYPFTSDEVRGAVASLDKNFWEILSSLFLTESPRFLNILCTVGVFFPKEYKIVFCILNPLVQLCIVYGLFYFVKGRKLDVNKQADFLPFLFICLTCLFMVPSPSTTMFWISGALNYSWAFLLCLGVLCLYRFTYLGNVFKNAWYVNLLCLLLGFAAGMSNENTGPMMFGISLCFFLFCKYKKIKIPAYVYLSFLGIICGVTAMFGLGGSAERLKNYGYTFFVNAELSNKLFYSLHRFNGFLKALYFMPVALFVGLPIMAYDLKKKVFKEKFLLSAFFLFCGLLTAFVLFAAPMAPGRAYYSAGVFCLISFFFFLDFFYDAYKIYALKYFTLLFLAYCLVITPLVIFPYVSLYQNFKARDAQILLSKEQGKKSVCADIIYAIPAPTKNLTIEYLDLIKHHSPQHKETLKKWYGIEVIVPDETNFSFTNKNPLMPRYTIKLDR